MKFKTIPSKVEAIQLSIPNSENNRYFSEYPSWLLDGIDSDMITCVSKQDNTWRVTEMGPFENSPDPVVARPKDWIVHKKPNHFKVIRNEIFNSSYERDE